MEVDIPLPFLFPTYIFYFTSCYWKLNLLISKDGRERWAQEFPAGPLCFAIHLPASMQWSQHPWRSQMQFIVWKYSKRSYAAMRKVLKNVVSLAVSPSARYDLMAFIPLEQSPLVSTQNGFFSCLSGCPPLPQHPPSLHTALLSPFPSATVALCHVLFLLHVSFPGTPDSPPAYRGCSCEETPRACSSTSLSLPAVPSSTKIQSKAFFLAAPWFKNCISLPAVVQEPTNIWNDLFDEEAAESLFFFYIIYSFN